ncbi:hypothetical protein KUTeg_012013 [Tegillarca granosa]|uniref:Metallo-beta-lactamase domain-containing protein n=1 Tax=Tegillarca granosa TaxID=220873 RepID=A0ABQ9EYC0_TEGGR|nr:hypothetical protein KUTeg_012013 [Tegillarca granosa]
MHQKARDQTDNYKHHTFEFSQCVSIPHHATQMELVYFITQRKVQIFGFRKDGIPKQLNFLIDEHDTIGKDGTQTSGPNAVISMIDWSLESDAKTGTKFCFAIYAENCPGIIYFFNLSHFIEVKNCFLLVQNKNQFVIRYFMLGVLTQRNTVKEYLTQVPVDLLLLKKLCRRSDCDSIEQLQKVFEKSAGSNTAKMPILLVDEPYIVTVKRNRDTLEEKIDIKKPEIDIGSEALPEVTENVYVAIGYALGNSIMVIAPDGLIIVDVTETADASKEIFEEFRKISTKPVKAIVYTHYHHDHIMGAKVDTIEQFKTYAFAIRFTRSNRQFGNYVPDSNGGLGNGLARGEEGFVIPNKFVDKPTVKANVAGESNDQIGMWVPEWKMFFCGDTFYFAFPNLYAIRGTPMRDPKFWYSSVQKIADLKPKYLVLSHHYPVQGKAKIQEYLTNYRDAIQYVHDQALRYINKGYYPDKVVEMVKLPQHLADLPYLQQCYGVVAFSVKGVFQLFLGWFSGDPAELLPMPYSEKAKRMKELVGGVSSLVEKAREALKSGDNQWALELSSFALELKPDNDQARQLKTKALTALGDNTSLTLAKNYYKTFALEVSGIIELKFQPEYIHELVYSYRMRQLFELMPAMYIAENCSARTDIVLFQFRDTGLEVYVQLRNGVAIISDSKPEGNDVFSITFASENLFRDLVIDMADGTGWPFPVIEIIASQIQFETPFTMSRFSEIMHCFDWYMNAKTA